MEPGRRLGAYEILGPLGASGMGEVYRARDTNLGRQVAVKVLPEDFAADLDHLGRFSREARLLASLNHPNIATVHGFEEVDGVRFLAMELVEGETLEERIAASGPVELEEAVAIAAEMADGLETAHEAGIIHRDLKPANVKVTPGGQVKVLQPAISLSGDLIAYTSEESGRRQVYIQRYPRGERIDVSLEGGNQPVWSPDGSELFFRRGDQLLKVDIGSDPGLTASRPQVLFEMPLEHGSGFGITPHYDISHDGQRFLVVSDRPTTELKVIFNWFRELQERVPGVSPRR